MSQRLETVAIIGVGLVGGSLAAALRRLPDVPHVVGVMRSAEKRAWAVDNGVLDEALSPQEALESGLFGPDGAQLVVLGTPVEASIEWLQRLGEAGFAGLVTDVASTKSAIQEAAERYLAPPAVFIGGHPMAGSEKTGVEASNADLFQGAYYVLTPADDTPADLYGRLHKLLSAIGARVISIRPEAHDEAVAAISHVPHVAASALTNLAAARVDAGHDVLRLAAGGFKDMTRIAAGSPDLWTGILSDNRAAVVRGLTEYAGQLSSVAGMLEADDRDGIAGWLARAADVRRGLPAQWVPASERLSVLSVPVSDKPGVVSAVTQAAARAACNIEDIEIDHTSEDTAVLRLVLTDEGDMEALVVDLAQQGFEPTLRPLSEEGA